MVLVARAVAVAVAEDGPAASDGQTFRPRSGQFARPPARLPRRIGAYSKEARRLGTKFWQTLRLGLKSLLLHKLRSGLAILGIFIGVTAVIWLVAMGEGVSY